MKKHNKKLITLLLTGAVCCTAAFGVATMQAFAEETTATVVDPAKYALSDLFNSANVGATENKTTFTLKNGENAYYRNSIALKWNEGKKDAAGNYEASYFTLKFGFADANFTSVTMKMESSSSIAAEKEKATNAVKFTKVSATDESVNVQISVIADGSDEVVVCDAYTAEFGKEITIALSETELCAYSDQYEVLLTNDANVAINTTRAIFKNIGANYAAYETTAGKEMYPLQFTVETPEKEGTGDNKTYEQTKIYLYELNNQRFDNVTENKIVDTAPPVLVVNEDINGFMLGSAFSLNYQVIDVAKKSLTSSEKVINYYQYNPTNEAVNYDKKLTTSTYFMETVYEKDGKDTTVYVENNNEEFVSIRFTLADATFKVDTAETHEYNKAVYDLVWYAESAAIRTMSLGDPAVATEYIVINQSNEGAKFAKDATGDYIKAEDGVNKYLMADGTYVSEEEDGAYANSELKKFVDNYNALLVEAAKDVYAGSNAYIYFPTFEGLIYDDNGYNNLKFTICYKTETGGAMTSSGLSSSALKLSASTAGNYEFKIIANDQAENKMKYYLDGELVEVTSANVWDIEAIPTFEYTIKNQGLKIKDEDSTKTSDKTASKAIGETYSLSGITVVGASENQKSEFALYKVDVDKCTKNGVNVASFSKITYKEIREAVEKKLATVTDGDYMALYLDVYLTKLAEITGASKSILEECFIKIEAYNSKITEDDAEWDAYNKYEFQKSSSSSFKVVDDGDVYIMFADYYDELYPTYSRVAAYKVIKAEEEADVIKGETEWLKNNLVSVILFSVAAVMLILIIILLLIKPSDETLEDVDEKANDKKASKKDKKSKK